MCDGAYISRKRKPTNWNSHLYLDEFRHDLGNLGIPFPRSYPSQIRHDEHGQDHADQGVRLINSGSNR